LPLHFSTLKVENYRNITAAQLQLSPGLNVMCGGNAQGKTNLLEAMCLCCLGRSFRGARDRELIRMGGDYARVDAACASLSGAVDISVYVPREGRKRIEVCGAPVPRLSSLLGVMVSTVFSPDDLSLVKEGPAQRRRFLDIDLCQLYPGYFDALSRYERALAQRNSLLRQCAEEPGLASSLDAWDAQLAGPGIRLVEFRQQYCDAVFMEAHAVHAGISGGEQLSCGYQPQDVLRAGQKGFLEGLWKSRREDIARGSTGIGPHRDDFSVMLGGLDIRAYGSQGQQRTAALSLKLAQLRHAGAVLGEPPVFLLDDVLSELDEKRQKALSECLSGLQTVLTCAFIEPPAVLCASAPAVFRVQDGSFTLSG
jgi:DNA replication and repair protein RecF